MQLTALEIASFTAGALVVPAYEESDQVIGFSWDSRTVSQGVLYVALVGERVDGHDFCEQAIEAGALCLLVSQTPSEELCDKARSYHAAIVQVEDTQQAFTELAAAWRGSLQGIVIALTGSSGKTTTKNLIRDVLSMQGSVVATQGNQNNELGVPATLLRADQDTQFVVVEMGMRGLGQIEALCSFVKPDIALVTNVGESHIELLGSRDAIAQAKAEIFAGVKANTGSAFINSSDDFVRELAQYGATEERGVEVFHFDGSGKDPNEFESDIAPVVYAQKIVVDKLGCPSFDLITPEGEVAVTLNLPGLHNVHNATAAAAVGMYCGMQPEKIASGLAGSQAVQGRQRVIETKQGYTVVDDAYNANPDSMRASLDLFELMHVNGAKRAVLGDMGELGVRAQSAHAEVGARVAQMQLEELICVGELSRIAAQAACESGMDERCITCVDTASEALALIQSHLSEGDVVLIKASHSVGLDAVVQGLVNEDV